MTLRTRLALWYSGLLMVVIIIFSIVVITVSRVTLLQTVDQILTGLISNVRHSIDPVPVDDSDTDGAVELVYQSEELFHAPGVSVQIWRTHEGGVTLDTPVLDRNSVDIEGMQKSLDPNYIPGDNPVINSIMVNEIPERVISQVFHTSDGVPIGIIQVATPLSAVASANDQLLVITLVTAIICMGVSIGLGKWLSTHLLKPIDTIKSAAANVAKAEDLTNRILWNGPEDELGQLANSFNHMMGRLESVFQVQQDFIRDVSHELRTPLTSIIGHLELIDKYGVDKDSLDALQRESERMSRMVNDLLLLTRADSGDLPVDLYPVDLDYIVLEVFEQTLVLAKDRKLNIELKRIEPVRINGNSDRIRQLMLNLISNAIKFTTDDGSISISIYADKANAVIEIADTGIGINEEDLKRIFDRFFQADAARVHHGESDGAGLGLSIARWIVDIHKGQIDVQSKVGEGTTFSIRFPTLESSISETVIPGTGL